MIETWNEVRDGDDRLHSIYERHYSSRPHRLLRRHWPNWKRICSPGEHIILLSPLCDALFVWVKARIRDDGQEGVNCSVFRNEGHLLSSELIREAEKWAWDKWPQERLFTYIDGERTKKRRSKRSLPGECFLQAGWHYVMDGAKPYRSKKGLYLLEQLWDALSSRLSNSTGATTTREKID